MAKKAKAKSSSRLWLGRVASIIVALAVIALVGILITVFINNFSGKESSLFGYKIVYILTDSMSPELEQGTTILTKECSADDLILGDYVTFVAASGRLTGHNVTHEVVALPYLNSEDGKWYISTRGTKVGAPLDDPVPVENVRAKFISKLPVITFIMKLLKNPWGYAMLIAVPLITMLVFQLIRMAKVSAEDAANKEQKKDNATLSKEELEAEIARRAVEDFIAEQNKKNAVEQGSQPPDCPQSCQNSVEQGNQSPDCPQEDIAQPSAPNCSHPDRNTDPKQDDKNID